MEKIDIIFFVFIIIFSITAIITFLGITNIISTIRARYLNALFGALILEVVAAVVITYKQIDFSCQTEAIITRLSSQLDDLPDLTTLEQKVAKLEMVLAASQKYHSELVVLRDELAKCEESKTTSTDELSKLDKVFYSNVIRLRIISEKFRGRTINLIFDKDNKSEVYDILKDIFVELGMVDPDDEPTQEYIINKYIHFARMNGLDYLLKTNDNGNYTQVLVDEYATTIFLRKYLNERYPLRDNASEV